MISEPYDEERLVGGQMLTKDQVNEALTYLRDEYGDTITLWDDARKAAEISQYWDNQL
jgi:hypothetical protein